MSRRVSAAPSTGNPGWPPFDEEFARSFSVIVPDLPGYRQSERPEWARDARDMAMRVSKLLETRGLAGVTLVGLGCGAAFGAAREHPERQGRREVRCDAPGALECRVGNGKCVYEWL